MEKSIKEISLEITKLNEELKGLELMNIVLQFHFLIG